jgi:hypothetical protein
MILFSTQESTEGTDLAQRTDDYHRWVEAFAKKRNIPLEWAQKGVRKEDYVRVYLRRMERRNQFGIYFILKSMELGTHLPFCRAQIPYISSNANSSAPACSFVRTIMPFSG